MVNELSKQQRKVLFLLVTAILLGVGRLGFRAFSRGTLELHLVAPVTVAWPTLDPERLEPGPPVLALSLGATEEAADAETNPEVEPAPPVKKEKGTPPSSESAPAEAVFRRLDPNTATIEELKTLPGIGPVLAARIIEYRETVAKFRTIEDLLAVKGIGEKTLAKIRPYLEIKE